MKVLLIEPPFYLFQDIQSSTASLGLAMLAGQVSREGHDVKIFSPDLELPVQGKREQVITNHKNVEEKMSVVKDRLKEIIEHFQPAAIGISFWTARADAGMELAKYVKKITPKIIVVGGGIHATLLPEGLLKSGAIDFVVRGEGEFAFASLIKTLDLGQNPKNKKNDCLSFVNENGRIIHEPIAYCDSLDELPFPGYEHFLNYESFNKDVFRSIMFSRGCPFQCTYCASHKLWTRKVRFHTPSYMVAMVKHLHQKFGIEYFQFDDDTFTLKKKSVVDFCSLLKQEGLAIKWHCDTRVECVTKELLEVMRDAGLEAISMGVESGDIDVRKMIKKTSSLEATKKAFTVARNLGIMTRGYFMIGIPGETYEQASKTLDFVKEVNPDIPCVSICIPYPGTESFQVAQEMGTIKDSDSIDWSMCYHHSNINFSGNISEKEWKMLLSRCHDIELEARGKREGKTAKSTLMQIKKDITIGKIMHRYLTQPANIFKDFNYIVSLVFKIRAGR